MSTDLSSVTESHLSYQRGTTDAGFDGTPGLYGRASEKLKLLQVYERVVQTGTSEVVCIHGESGTGKTSLVDSLREQVCQSEGFVCAGKFFQNSGVQEPYSALMTAFSDLCDLTVQSGDFDDQRRREIGMALGLDGYLLARSINLSPFLSDSKLWKEAASRQDNFGRFKTVCKTFLYSMASKQHPVILFIDDLQWMDGGSKQLIDTFLHDKELKYVVLVLSYRDEETDAVEELLHGGECFVDIHLGNLGLSDVQMMVCGHLGETTVSTEICELCDIVLQKTRGNPFFVLECLETMKDEGMLTLEGSTWKFDSNEIKARIMVSESIADVLAQRIQQLSTEVRDTLIAASLLGYSFKESILVAIVGQGVQVAGLAEMKPHDSPQITRSYLKQAIDAGFIEEVEGGFQFTHDKLQAAFEEAADQSTQRHLHVVIGEAYLEAHDGGESSMIYNAAVHLNQAPGYLSDDVKHDKLADINLQASKYCQQRSAYLKAVYLLQTGISLLAGDIAWSPENFDLTYEMTESLAKMALLVGDFTTCREALEEATNHVNSVDRKMDLILIGVECRMANNEMEDSVIFAVAALSDLGVKFPKKVSWRHVIPKLLKVMFSMANKSDDDLLGLPVAQDRRMEVAVTLLLHVCAYSLMVDEELPALFASLLATELTLRHGSSTFSATAIGMYGLVLLEFGNVERAYRLGKLALRMMERNTSRDADCATIGLANTLLLHWKDPPRVLQEPLIYAANSGFDRGDLVYGVYCLSQYMDWDIVLGSNIDRLHEARQIQYNRIKERGQRELLLWLKPGMQFYANLQSDSKQRRQLVQLSGDYMQEAEQLQEANAAKNVVVAVSALVLKATLSCYFGFYGQAVRIYEEVGPMGQSFHYSYSDPLWRWGEAVANFEQYRISGLRKNLRKARKSVKPLRKLEAVGSPVAPAFLTSLSLKEKFVKKRIDDDALMLAFDNGIAELSKTDNEALKVAVYRDAGRAAMRMGRTSDANRYFGRAMDVCRNDWGSLAVFQWMEQKGLGGPSSGERNARDTNKFLGDIIELPGTGSCSTKQTQT